MGDFHPHSLAPPIAMRSAAISTSMMRPLAVALFVLLAISPWHSVSAADANGWFGMSVSVDADAISLNPTIRSIKVVAVAPSSPAAVAGLLAGDSIVEVQGITVAGARADVLKVAMRKAVGESLDLKIRRGTAESREARLVAIAKP
jgi:S1-C subfamily serine protease